jgi:RecT family
MTGSEIERVNAESLAMRERFKYAQELAKARSPLLPTAFRGSPADLLLVIEYGKSLNLPIAQVFTDVHLVNGKPGMSAKLMQALILRAGHRIRAWNPDPTSGMCRIIRSDDPEPYEVTWTIGDAVQAGLVEIKNGKVWARDSKGQPTPWERYTRTMLRNRAISEAARAHCPDVLAGVAYTPEELQEGMVIDATVVDATPADPVPDQATEQQPAAAAAAAATTAAPDFAAPKEPTEGEWRTTWFDQLADAVRRRNLADITKLGQDAAAAGHSDLIDAARAAWTRVQQAPIPDPTADVGDQDDDTGGADMDDPVVDAELVEDSDA